MPESFEEQAMMLRRLAGACDNKPKQRFEEVAKVMDKLAALRKKCLSARNRATDEDFTDELGADIIKLLDLPVE